MSGWISVEERLPDDDSMVIALIYPFNSKLNMRIAVQACFIHGGFYEDDGGELHPPTHWMPMPPIPEAP